MLLFLKYHKMVCFLAIQFTKSNEMQNENDRLSRVIFQEAPRDFRTEIPNIVFELLENGDINSSDFALYCVYRRIAGQNGACWYGTRDLSEKAGVSKDTITKSKKVLSKPFEKLNGLALITITPGDRKKEEADLVTINDLWYINHHFFKNKLTCPKIRYTPVRNKGTPLSENKVHKNEQVKNEPIKKVSIGENVHNSAVDSGNSKVPFVSPAAIPAEGSIPFHGKREEHQISLEDDIVTEIICMEDKTLKYFRPNVVVHWMKKFGPPKVLETIKFFLKTIATSKTKLKNPEAWMESAFKKGFVEDDTLLFKNKQFAENLKNKHNLRNLKINKRYCIDTNTGNDAYYNLPSEVFEGILLKMIGR